MRGSSWNKWNLHIHTKGTNKNDQFVSPDMDAFFEVFFRKALKENVSAIAVTDYFSIDNYLKAKEYAGKVEQIQNASGENLFAAAEIALIKNLLILPNVELRMLPVTQAGKLINIHCIFNPVYVPRLANDFFNSLQNQEKHKMNRDGFIQYGKSLNSTLNDDAAYSMGLNNFVIAPGSLKMLLDENADFRNNTLIVVSNSNKDGNSGLQEHYALFQNEPGSLDGVRRTIYAISDAVFSANKKDVDYFLGKRRDNEQGVTEQQKKAERDLVLFERGSFKPCLVGCDAHTEDELFTKFTWIKGQLDFQGLRQIMYEPEQRVKIQLGEPDEKDPKLVIDRVRFISDNNMFSPVEIKFNRNLNVIIGGKSSGKSILLYCIAKTLLPDRSILKNEIEPYDYKYDFGQGFDFEVTLTEGHTQSINRADQTPSILPEIKYIPQNHLSKLAEADNKKGNELVKLIRALLVEDQEYKLKYDEFLNRLRSNDGNIELIINTYFDLQARIANQKRDLIQQGDQQVLQDNITSNERKIQELKEGAGLSDEQIGQYNQLNSELGAVDTDISKLRSDHSKITSFQTDATNIIRELLVRKDLLLTSLENQTVKEFFEEQYSILQESLTKLAELSSLITLDEQRKFLNDNIFKTLFTENNDKRKTLADALAPFLKDLANKKQIEDLERLVATDRQKLASMQQARNEITNNEAALLQEKEKLFSAYRENFREYEKLVEEFRGRTSSLTSDRLNILGKPRFNFPKFRAIIAQKMDGRKANFNAYPMLATDKTGTSDFTIDDLINHLKSMFGQMAESNNFPFVSRVDAKATVKELLADHFFDYWDVVYDGDELTKMSAGKASFVILMLIVGLSKSKAPILIDQPEDNLDNRSITKDLVEYLRNKKLERQIILVTHNANVVVNADAENIIVANQKGQNESETSSPYQFDYINGPLEFSLPKDERQKDLLKSMGIREHVTEIVEGGEDAFRKRERKYGFTKR